MENGVFLSGAFMGFEKYSGGDNGPRTCFALSVGMTSYRIYLTGDLSEVGKSLKVGDPILMKARPYVSQRGYLSWADGEIVSMGERNAVA